MSIYLAKSYGKVFCLISSFEIYRLTEIPDNANISPYRLLIRGVNSRFFENFGCNFSVESLFKKAPRSCVTSLVYLEFAEKSLDHNGTHRYEQKRCPSAFDDERKEITQVEL